MVCTKLLSLLTVSSLTTSSVVLVSGFVQQQPRAFITTTTTSSSSSIAESSSSEMVDWDVRPADVAEMDLVADMIERKCEFDRSLNGEPKSKLPNIPGNSLSSLCPRLPHSKFLLVEEMNNNNDSNSDDTNNNEPIGFATYAMQYYGFEPPVMWIEDVFVDPNIRSQGAGRAMMEQMADIAKTQNCKHLAWEADERNERGIQFYENLGAKQVGQKGSCIAMEWKVNE